MTRSAALAPWGFALTPLPRPLPHGSKSAYKAEPYRAIDQKHVPRYLAESEYRFNRRYDLAAMMMPRLTLVVGPHHTNALPPAQTG
jgi:hypothetical protein